MQETTEVYEHQLQDGWECVSLSSPMMVCSNCSQTVGGWSDHVTKFASGTSQNVYSCTPPRGDTGGAVSEGERRILNTIGTENATGSLTHAIAVLCNDQVEIREELKQLKRQLHSTSADDIKYLHVEINRLADERDAALAEVEFLRVKVEELRNRNLIGELPER